MKKEYYGDKKIKEIVKLDSKTYFGKERVKLLFDDSSVELPKEIADKSITKESTDLTTLVKIRVEPAISQIMAVITESELTVDEINYMMPFITETTNMNIDKANKILWGKEKGEKTLRDVDKILQPKKY